MILKTNIWVWTVNLLKKYKKKERNSVAQLLTKVWDDCIDIHHHSSRRYEQVCGNISNILSIKGFET